MCGVSGTICGS